MLIDAAEYRRAQREFEALQTKLRAAARRTDRAGAIARAALHFMPVLLIWLQHERRAGIEPRQSFEGLAGALALIAEHAIRCTQAPAGRARALDELLHIMHVAARPRLHRGGDDIVLPSQFLNGTPAFAAKQT